MNKVKHAYGSRKNLTTAIEAGTVNAYDILLLNGEGEIPAVGWVDKDGNPVIVETTGEDDVLTVESLPETGELGKIYIFENEAYIWNGTSFVPLAQDADLTDLQNQINTKVDATTVQTMIDESVTNVVEVVEF